jgi:DNA-binding NtrC family response regulator
MSRTEPIEWGGEGHRSDAERALVVGKVSEGAGCTVLLGRRLIEAGFAVYFASDGSDALAFLARQTPALVVANDEHPRLDGIELVRRLRERSDVPVLVVSAGGSVPACEEAMRVGADRFLQRSCDLERIGLVARELVNEKPVSSSRVRPPALTAASARTLRERELFDLLEGLLLETRGNIAEMARRIGRDRSTVRYHLRRFGMLEGNADPRRVPSTPPRR